MASVVLNFVGGIPFQGLHDVVKMAIHKSRKFKTHLVNLEFTLRCFKSRTLEQIIENNIRLNLEIDTVEDLERKMTVGKVFVEKLSKLSMWNIRIWGNCCNCIGPDYAKELDDLDRSLRSLLESLQVEQGRNVTELVSLAREAKDRQDDMEKRQGELEKKVDAILRGQQESNAISMEQREAIQRLVLNSVQQAPSSSGGGAADPALGVAFRQLVDAVIQVEVENMMLRRLLDTFKSTLYCLQPLIEEVVEHGRVVHLPKQEVENLIILLVSGVELVHKCSKVCKHANYKKYKFTDKIFNLEESIFRLFIELKGQVERTLKEAMDSANKIEMAIKKIETEGLCNVQLPGLPSPAVGFDILNKQGRRDVTEETQLDSASVKVEQIEGCDAVQNQMKTEGSSDLPPELHSPADGSDVLNMQGPLDLTATNIQVVVTESEEISAVDDSIRNVRETTDLLDKESSESEPAFPTVLFDVPDVHETSDEEITQQQMDKQPEIEIATAIPLSSSPAIGWTSAWTTNKKAKLKQLAVGWTSGWTINKKAKLKQPAEKKMMKVAMKVRSYDGCDGCQRRFSEACKQIAQVKGIQSISTDKENKMITIVGEGLDPKKLVEILKKKMRGAEILSVGPAKEEETILLSTNDIKSYLPEHHSSVDTTFSLFQ